MHPFPNSPALAGLLRDMPHSARTDDDMEAPGRRREAGSGPADLPSRPRDFQAHLRSAANVRARFNARCGEGETIETAVAPWPGEVPAPRVTPPEDAPANEAQDNAALLVAALATVQPATGVLTGAVVEAARSRASTSPGSAPVANDLLSGTAAPEETAISPAAETPGESSLVEAAPDFAADLPRPAPVRDGRNPAGTAAAEQPVPMKNAVEMENNAGADVQNLPVREFVPENPARHFNDRRAELRDASEEIAAVRPTAPVTGPMPAAPLQTTTAAAPAEAVHASRAAERVAEAMLRGVAEVRHTGAQELAVILRPDADTELLLRVRMCDGAMQAQLRFERGDRAPLEAHWADLHQRLAQQGVQLTLADASTSGGGKFSQPDARHPAPEESPAMPNLIGRGATVATTPATAPRLSKNLFDQWA